MECTEKPVKSGVQQTECRPFRAKQKKCRIEFIGDLPGRFRVAIKVAGDRTRRTCALPDTIVTTAGAVFDFGSGHDLDEWP
jgi:hypothetical protein